MKEFTYPELRILREIPAEKKTKAQLKRYISWLHESEERFLRMAEKEKTLRLEHEKCLNSKKNQLRVV